MWGAGVAASLGLDGSHLSASLLLSVLPGPLISGGDPAVEGHPTSPSGYEFSKHTLTFRWKLCQQRGGVLDLSYRKPRTLIRSLKQSLVSERSGWGCAEDVLAENYSPGLWSACFLNAVRGACEGSSAVGAAVGLAGRKKQERGACVQMCVPRAECVALAGDSRGLVGFKGEAE